MAEKIEGLIVAALTPFDRAGELDLSVVPAQAALYDRNHAAGVFVGGSTGEGVLLTTQERMTLTARWASEAPAGFKVIAHVGHASLKEAQAMASAAADAGAWAISALAPFFFKPATLDDLVDYCRLLASAAPDLPFYYYHIPSLTGVLFPMAEFLEKAGKEIPTLAGIKYTHYDLMDFEMARQVDGGRFDILFGRDEHLLCGLALGARGAVGSTYNMAAPLYNDLIQAFDRGDLPAARALQHASMQLVQCLSQAGGSFFAACKAVMGFLDVPCGQVRPPLKNLSLDQKTRLQEKLQEKNISRFLSS